MGMVQRLFGRNVGCKRAVDYLAGMAFTKKAVDLCGESEAVND